jgi:hypothetical protein
LAPLPVRLRIAVTYYHEGAAVSIDTDNMVKPIQDALIGLVYVDDRQITDTTVRKTSINGKFETRWQSLVLLTAFSRGDVFVYVVIDHAPPHDRPLR